jgi:L-fuconolactonase
MRRIDAHHHVWDLAVRDQPWAVHLPELYRTFDFDELLPQLAAARIDGTIIVQTVTVTEETPELLALALSTPQIAGVIGWLPLDQPDVSDRLMRLSGGPGGHALVGVRHQVQEEPDPRYLDRADVRRGLRAVAEGGVTYDLVVNSAQWNSVPGAVRAVPELRFVLDHAGKPPVADALPGPWKAWISELALLPNIAVKLSGLFTEAGADWTASAIRPYVDHLLESFGSARVMFGSDWPVSTLRANYGDVVAVTQSLLDGASQSEIDNVFGRTAAHWYGLEE